MRKKLPEDIELDLRIVFNTLLDEMEEDDVYDCVDGLIADAVNARISQEIKNDFIQVMRKEIKHYLVETKGAIVYQVFSDADYLGIAQNVCKKIDKFVDSKIASGGFGKKGLK